MLYNVDFYYLLIVRLGTKDNQEKARTVNSIILDKPTSK